MEVIEEAIGGRHDWFCKEALAFWELSILSILLCSEEIMVVSWAFSSFSRCCFVSFLGAFFLGGGGNASWDDSHLVVVSWAIPFRFLLACVLGSLSAKIAISSGFGCLSGSVHQCLSSWEMLNIPSARSVSLVRCLQGRSNWIVKHPVQIVLWVLWSSFCANSTCLAMSLMPWWETRNQRDLKRSWFW